MKFVITTDFAISLNYSGDQMINIPFAFKCWSFFFLA